MSVLSLSMRIGAELSSGFRNTIGQALKGLGDMDKGMAGVQNRLLDVGQALGTLYGIRRMVVGAGELSAELKDAGITAEVTNERLAELRNTMRGLSAPGDTNKSTRELVGVYRELVGAGLDDSLAGNTSLLRAVGRTGTAANADLKALARTTYTLVEMLGIKPEGLADEYDRLSYLGGKGRFEMEHMAQYFAELAPQAKMLGMVGTEAVASMGAALQIAMDGAGSQGEAANNMKNFLIKATAPDTVKKFAEAEVNLKEIMGKAMAGGKNPMEVLLTRIDEMLGTDKTKRKFRLGALFEDQQAQAFVASMLEGRAKYETLKAEALSGAAGGKVDKDYARRMEEFAAKSTAFANAVGNLGDSIGRSFLPPLGAALTIGTPMVTWLANISDKAPGTTLAITGVGAALVLLPPALRLGAFALRTFGTSGLFAAGGLRAVGVAMAANPIGLAVSGIALAAGLIYDNWATIKTFFVGIWDDVRSHWEGFVSFVTDAANMMSAPIQMLFAAGNALANLGMGKGLDTSALTNTAERIGESGKRMWDRVPKQVQRPDFGIDERPGTAAARAVTRGGAGADGKVKVELDFRNMPRGVDVKTHTTGPGVGDLDARTGYQMAGP